MTERHAPAELSFRALAFGLAVGGVLAAANVYAGLKLGFMDTGTTTLVLLSFAAFGAGARRFTPQEANIAQAAGSSAAVMAMTAGLIGPIPALAMGGREPHPLALVPWAIAVAVLGTLLAIPLRDRLVTSSKLAFPSARATGEVIRRLFATAAHDDGSVRLLGTAALAAAALTIARDAFGAIPGGWLLPVALLGVPGIGIAASPLLAGVGLLAGARVGLGMLLGAAIAWLAIAPVLVDRGIATPAFGSLVAWLMWPGAALLVAASLTTLVLDRRALVTGGRGPRLAGTARLAAVGAALVVIAIGWAGFGVHPLYAVLGVVLAVLCTPAAIHATGETDNTPAGPLGGLTQLVAGTTGPGAIDPPLQAGAVVNGATAHAATMANAWRTGELVGDCSPGRVLAAQLAGIACGAIAAVLAYALVERAYGIATAALPAPAAASWKATADAVARGFDGMPAGAPLAALAGALAGIALTLLERVPRLRGRVPSPVAMGIGFLMPASATITLALAALAATALAARAPAWHARGTPVLAAGLIVGEALAGVAYAAVLVASG